MGEAVERIERASGGRIDIEVYSSYELVPDEEIMMALKGGTLDLSFYLSPINPELTPSGYVEMSIPFNVDNPTEAEAVWFYHGLKEHIEQEYEDFGVKYICMFQADPLNCLITTTPVATIEDMDGLKISSYPALACPFIQAGAQVVTIPPEEFYLAGQTGVLDGLLWGGGEEYHWLNLWEAYPYYLGDHVVGALFCNILMNQEKWDSLPPDLQEILYLGFREASYRDAVRIYRGEYNWRPQWTVSRLSAEDLAQLKAYGTGPCWDELSAINEASAKYVQIFREFNEELEAVQWHRP
jgi:TRAP-type C4-dicarboxylate transport system substrate-binding protein